MAARPALLLALLAAAAALALPPLLLRGRGPARGAGAAPPAAAGAEERPPAELLRADGGEPAPRAEAPAPAAPDAPAPAAAPAATAHRTPPPERRADDPAAPKPPDAPGHLIQGRLRSRRGAFADRGRLLAGHVRFELHRSAPGGAPEPARVARLAPTDDPSGEEMIAFAFEDVPDGDYVLTASTIDAQRISPARLALRPPVGPLELWVVDDVEELALGFRVLDARTLEPVAPYTAWSIRTEVDPEAGVLFHAGPLELEQVPLDAAFRWRLWAEGYAPAMGDERAFALEEDGRFLAEVRLERGFGRRFVLLGRDPAMRPLKGARLFLDGAPAGETDAEGALEVVLPAPPREFSARWGALAASGKVPSDAAAALRAMTTVIVLEPPADR